MHSMVDYKASISVLARYDSNELVDEANFYLGIPTNSLLTG